MRSIAALKAGYAALFALFTWLLASVLRCVLANKVDLAYLVQLLTPLGIVGPSIAWLGWSVGRRLGLSRADAAAVALGSIIGGVNLIVFMWVMFRRMPADRLSASGSFRA